VYSRNACWRNFLYLAEDFDCVNHKISLAKLHFCGIRGLNADSSRVELIEFEIHLPYPTNCFSDRDTLKHAVNSAAFIVHNFLQIPFQNPLIFADDTSVITSKRNFGELCTMTNVVLSLV